MYDRVERAQLAVKQGKWTEENFIKPYQDILEQWAANFVPPHATNQERVA